MQEKSEGDVAPIRILHIGNIANNAWQNAKLMNQVEGFENIVLCADYYHTMGTPEWEEANFDASEVGDHFFPDWSNMNLNGFVRPECFVQGPLFDCLNFLNAEEGSSTRKRFANSLSIVNRTQRASWAYQQWTTWKLRSVAGGSAVSQRVRYCFLQLFYKLLIIALVVIAGRVRDVLSKPRKYKMADLQRDFPFTKKFLQRKQRASGISICRDSLRDELIADFAAKFPTRKDQLCREDFDIGIAEGWSKILTEFDVVQAYSIDPITMMLLEAPYFAFEHGTLRDIPFEDSPRGRLTALAYSRAEHVFVTNFDCLEKAHKLTGDASRVTFINHPFDENDLPDRSRCESLRRELCTELDADYLIFHPTRHDWIEGEGYNDKANDELLRAVGRLTRERGMRIGLILCDWGHNQAESRKLISELGYTSRTKLLAPQATRRFMVLCMSCDVVADQFKLGSFGGVLFKAMATGTAICTYLNEAEMLKIYKEVPPVIEGKTCDELVASLSRVLNNPAEREAIGQGGRRWIETHHCGSDTVAAQMKQYRNFLARSRMTKENSSDPRDSSQ